MNKNDTQLKIHYVHLFLEIDILILKSKQYKKN